MNCRAFVQATLVLVACTFFLWMFFAAATLERTADLRAIAAPSGMDANAAAYEYAAKWRHGMAGNSPIYMPGFFAAAVAFWFWCAGKTLMRTLAEGFILIGLASLFANFLAGLGVPSVMKGFRAQGFLVSEPASSGTWRTFAQGVYSLITWSVLIAAIRWSIQLKSPTPLLVPILLNLILAFVRSWTVAEFTSQWMRETVEGKSTAVISFLMIPMIASLISWIELRAYRRRKALRRLSRGET
jgi:hypothetical protein